MQQKINICLVLFKRFIIFKHFHQPPSLIKIKSTFAIETITVGGRILGVDQRWIAILEKATMAMWRPGSAIRYAVRLARIERLE